MEIKFGVEFNKGELNVLSEAVSILDNLINDMERYKTREVITKLDRTYDRDFIDEAAGMMVEFLNGIQLN